jgi:hypothetical protein
MLEADNKPLKKNINSVIMKSKKSLKLLLLVTVLLMMTTGGVYSQKQLTVADNTYYYFCAERQYFVKIQRGKIDAEKLLFLRSLYQSAVQLKLCMSKLYS